MNIDKLQNNQIIIVYIVPFFLGLLSDAFDISSTLFFAGLIGILIVSTIKLADKYIR